MKKRKAPNHTRRRTSPTVKEAPPPPLTVSIVTTPQTNSAGVSVHGDVELVKAALLYADKVELISMGTSMIGSVAAMAEGGTDALLALLTSLDDDALAHLNGGAPMPDGWREVLPLVVGLSGSPMGDELGIPNLEETLSETRDQFSRIAEDLVVTSGASELIPCINDGDADAVRRWY